MYGTINPVSLETKNMNDIFHRKSYFQETKAKTPITNNNNNNNNKRQLVITEPSTPPTSTKKDKSRKKLFKKQ